jgi:molybdopterin-containing oxidoreductase family iron-sulfur binding subunit
MKNSFQDGELIPVESLTAGTRPRLWRSVEEYKDPGAIRSEEPQDADENGSISLSGSDRRRFLALMAGSFALAGLSGCTRQPAEQIMPYVTAPEDAIPGRPKFYATAVPGYSAAEGVLVESHLGRPTKVEGNPGHPASLGSSSVHSQACLMDLYDADRAKEIQHLGVAATWDDFQLEFQRTLSTLRIRNGSGFYLLTETVLSPTLGDQIRNVRKAFPGAKWHQWEPVGNHSAREGARLAFGKAVHTYYRLDRADLVVSLDSDFLASGAGSTRYARDFATRRRRGDRTDMNRLYVIESTMTSTGGKADHRRPVRYRDVERLAMELAAGVGTTSSGAGSTEPADAWMSALVDDLKAHSGASVVIAGEHQSPKVHAAAHAINAALQNAGSTVIYTDPIEVEPTDQLESLKELITDLQANQVELLLVIGGNPVYNAPADLPFTEAFQKAKNIVRLGSHEDETFPYCHWHLPESHFLEDWSDTRANDGTITIQQPLIAPLYDSHSALRLLDAALESPGRSAYDIVQGRWRKEHGDNAEFDHYWRKSVHDGMISGSALPPIETKVNADWAGGSNAESGGSGLEVVFRPDVYLYDGRYANNVWLQELPHPMTKLTWDNAVHVNPKTARELKLENQHLVELIYQGRSVRGSVWITPGQPEQSITIHLGYGRWRSGRAGDGAGFSAYKIRTSNAMWAAAGLEVTAIDKPYPLATTQMQQFMEGRDIVLSANVDEYKQNPAFAKKRAKEPPKNETLYPQWTYAGYAWGMSIDLTACVNCNACVIACQAENNIAVVGKQQVLARRAMHWLRVDAYYEGNLENPRAHYQPVPCMQCENAPCELVCPVQATNHSRDGLNDMVYNRCVGTRYCSNNCPYKVRRFNFLLFSDWRTEAWKLERNPDVTVRSRGVMEKCTYCVQRIREAEIDARTHDAFIADGAIKTACQQACPTEAIVFGDINNPQNKVAKLKTEKLDYALLAELNTRPRTTYLAELRNPNPRLKEDNG